jgi:hypothetical protein
MCEQQVYARHRVFQAAPEILSLFPGVMAPQVSIMGFPFRGRRVNIAPRRCGASVDTVALPCAYASGRRDLDGSPMSRRAEGDRARRRRGQGWLGQSHRQTGAAPEGSPRRKRYFARHGRQNRRIGLTRALSASLSPQVCPLTPRSLVTRVGKPAGLPPARGCPARLW